MMLVAQNGEGTEATDPRGNVEEVMNTGIEVEKTERTRMQEKQTNKKQTVYI